MALPFRRLLERLSRGVVIKRRLPAHFGRRQMYLSPANQLSVLKFGDAKFVASLLGFAQRFVRTDDVVWDIGANMGVFSVPAAHRAKTVIAFEPDPFNLELLHRTQSVNRDLSWEVVPAAMSNVVGTSKFAIPERGRAANSLAGVNFGTQTGGVRQEYTVITITADWALEHYPAPDFVKCDAEGAETWILEGATRLLAEARPAIVIEVSGVNGPGCAEIFRANRYVMMSAYPKVDRAGIVDDISDVWDVLAIPEEKLDQYLGR